MNRCVCLPDSLPSTQPRHPQSPPVPPALPPFSTADRSRPRSHHVAPTAPINAGRGARSGASCGRSGAERSAAPESGETRTGTGTGTGTPWEPRHKERIPSPGAGRGGSYPGVEGVSPRRVLEGPVPAAEGVSCPGESPPGGASQPAGGPVPRRVLSHGRGVRFPSAGVETPSRGASSQGNFIPGEGVPRG